MLRDTVKEKNSLRAKDKDHLSCRSRNRNFCKTPRKYMNTYLEARNFSNSILNMKRKKLIFYFFSKIFSVNFINKRGREREGDINGAYWVENLQNWERRKKSKFFQVNFRYKNPEICVGLQGVRNLQNLWRGPKKKDGKLVKTPSYSFIFPTKGCEWSKFSKKTCDWSEFFIEACDWSELKTVTSWASLPEGSREMLAPDWLRLFSSYSLIFPSYFFHILHIFFIFLHNFVMFLHISFITPSYSFIFPTKGCHWLEFLMEACDWSKFSHGGPWLVEVYGEPWLVKIFWRGLWLVGIFLRSLWLVGIEKRDSVSCPPSTRDVSVTRARTRTRFLRWLPVPKGKVGLPPKPALKL